MALLLLVPFSANATQKKAIDFTRLRAKWEGKYPDEKGQFIAAPEVRNRLAALLGEKYVRRLSRLKREPYYLMNLMEVVDGYIVADFPPNLRFNEDGDRIMIFTKLSDGALHVAFIADGGEVRWAHDGEPELSAKTLARYEFLREATVK